MQSERRGEQEKDRTMSRMKVWLVVGLALAVAVPAVAQDGEEKNVRKIQIKKIVECADGEDCEERSSRMVFVGDDGDVRVLHGDDTEWVSEDNVRILKGSGHDVILIEDGDGEDGSSIRRRMHRVMQRIAEGGRGLHPPHGSGAFLGVQLSDLTAELRTHFGVPEDVGVMVGKVVDGSPAFRAGLEVGDIVTAVDGAAVDSASSLARAIRGHEDGDTVVLEVWRDGRMEKISAALEERGRQVAMASASSSAAGGQGEARVIAVEVDCEDGEDCTVDIDNTNSFEFAASACGGSGECEVNVDCDGGDCACTVNGEATDCSALGISP